jgi:hypothetical protein
MDKDLYTVDSVGECFNERFMSMKLQMDLTRNDNERAKSWRRTAREIESRVKSVDPVFSQIR